jgi:ATP-dependent DNA helicase RecQ
MFAYAQQGRTWYTLDVGSAAEKMRQERSRLVRAVEYLEQQGWVELQVADLRHQYSLLRRPPDLDELISILAKRFQRREQQEIRRVSQIVELVTQDGCHCTWCRNPQPLRLPAQRPMPPLPSGLDASAFRSLRNTYPDALGDSRQAARFLCGLTSPALTKHKLTRHNLFGIFEERRFADVLSWCK